MFTGLSVFSEPKLVPVMVKIVPPYILPVFGETAVTSDPTLRVADEPIMPIVVCLIEMSYSPLIAPPNINFTVLAESSYSTTLSCLKLEALFYWVKFTEKSLADIRVTKKSDYKVMVMFCFNTGDTELGDMEMVFYSSFLAINDRVVNFARRLREEAMAARPLIVMVGLMETPLSFAESKADVRHTSVVVVDD